MYGCVWVYVNISLAMRHVVKKPRQISAARPFDIKSGKIPAVPRSENIVKMLSGPRVCVSCVCVCTSILPLWLWTPELPRSYAGLLALCQQQSAWCLAQSISVSVVTRKKTKKTQTTTLPSYQLPHLQEVGPDRWPIGQSFKCIQLVMSPCLLLKLCN